MEEMQQLVVVFSGASKASSNALAASLAESVSIDLARASMPLQTDIVSTPRRRILERP
jgi:hypothetical protein